VRFRQRFFHQYYRPRPGPLDKFLNRPKAKDPAQVQAPTFLIASPRIIAFTAKAGGATDEQVEAFLKQYPDLDEPREWRTP
jgi:hypothetical protein